MTGKRFRLLPFIFANHNFALTIRIQKGNLEPLFPLLYFARKNVSRCVDDVDTNTGEAVFFRACAF